MERSLEHVASEIDKLREDLHRLYDNSRQITPDVLMLSCELDEKINQYLRMKNAEKNGDDVSKQN